MLLKAECGLGQLICGGSDSALLSVSGLRPSFVASTVVGIEQKPCYLSLLREDLRGMVFRMCGVSPALRLLLRLDSQFWRPGVLDSYVVQSVGVAQVQLVLRTGGTGVGLSHLVSLVNGGKGAVGDQQLLASNVLAVLDAVDSAVEELVVERERVVLRQNRRIYECSAGSARAGSPTDVVVPQQLDGCVCIVPKDLVVELGGRRVLEPCIRVSAGMRVSIVSKVDLPSLRLVFQRDLDPFLPAWGDPAIRAVVVRDEVGVSFASGYCYLALFQPQYRCQVASACGSYPTLYDLRARMVAVELLDLTRVRFDVLGDLQAGEVCVCHVVVGGVAGVACSEVMRWSEGILRGTVVGGRATPDGLDYSLVIRTVEDWVQAVAACTSSMPLAVRTDKAAEPMCDVAVAAGALGFGSREAVVVEAIAFALVPRLLVLGRRVFAYVGGVGYGGNKSCSLLYLPPFSVVYVVHAGGSPYMYREMSLTLRLANRLGDIGIFDGYGDGDPGRGMGCYFWLRADPVVGRPWSTSVEQPVGRYNVVEVGEYRLQFDVDRMAIHCRTGLRESQRLVFVGARRWAVGSPARGLRVAKWFVLPRFAVSQSVGVHASCLVSGGVLFESTGVGYCELELRVSEPVLNLEPWSFAGPS